MYQGIKTVSFEEAVKVVKSGDRIHIHSVACAPQGLIQALCNRGRAGELRDVKLQHLHTEGSAPYAEAEFEGIFFLESYFVGSNAVSYTHLLSPCCRTEISYFWFTNKSSFPEKFNLATAHN